MSQGSGSAHRTHRVALLLGVVAALALPTAGFADLPLRSALRPDGRIDLEALRHSGYHGAVDITDHVVQLADNTLEVTDRRGRATGPESLEDARWWDGFQYPGVDGTIRAMALYQGDLIITGEFKMAGNEVVNGLARWDGAAWHGYGSGLQGTIIGPYGDEFGPIGLALTIFQGDLIVAGQFSSVAGVGAGQVARFDGQHWSAVGPGFIGMHAQYVSCLTIWRGELIAGGWFLESGGVPLNNLARWNGTQWLGIPGQVGQPRSLAVYDNQLVVAGNQYSAEPALLRWDGTSMTPFGPELLGWVNQLTIFNGELIAGGAMTLNPGNIDVSVARWDGAHWNDFAPGLPGEAFAFAVEGNALYATTSLRHPGGGWSSVISRRDGTSWTSWTPDLDGYVTALAFHGSHLVAGGTFQHGGTAFANNIAAWTGAEWQPFGVGFGLNGIVSALAVFNGDLIAGGAFTSAGGVPARMIARWDGTRWWPLGDGFTGYYADDAVLALAVHQGQLIAGGDFVNSGGTEVDGLARWDGTRWLRLGLSQVDGYPPIVHALHVNGSELVIAGDFTKGGALTLNRIARWDGNALSGYGNGMNAPVYALATLNGALVAGGDFGYADNHPINRIARWNGNTWTPLGTGPNAKISALSMAAGTLYAGGAFTQMNGLPMNRVARWDGTAWHSVGSGVGGWVRALASYDGELVAGGLFTQADGQPAERLARWNGSAWTGLPAGGVGNGDVRALLPYAGSLYAGGSFMQAGGLPSLFLGRLEPPVRVRLESLTATRVNGEARLAWQATDETGSVGYRVHRATDGAPREAISGLLIAGRKSYAFIDTAAPTGGADYWVEELLRGGASRWYGPVTLAAGLEHPPVLSLAPNHPNPFHGSTRIQFTLMNAGPVQLAVHDAQGRVVAELMQGVLAAGTHELLWEGRDRRGRPVVPGAYFIHLSTPAASLTRKALRLP